MMLGPPAVELNVLTAWQLRVVEHEIPTSWPTLGGTVFIDQTEPPSLVPTMIGAPKFENPTAIQLVTDPQAMAFSPLTLAGVA
jgi:hypothetical protein